MVKYIVQIGFSIVIFLVVMMVAAMLQQINSVNATLSDLVKVSNAKVEYVYTMRNAILQRQSRLAYMFVQDDPFDRDEEISLFNEYAVPYLHARERLLALPTDEGEKEIHAQLIAKTRIAYPLNQQAVELMRTYAKPEAIAVAFKRARESQDEVLAVLNKLVLVQKQYGEKIVIDHQSIVDHLVSLILFMALITLFLVFAIAYYVSRFVATKNQQLIASNAKLAAAYDGAEAASRSKAIFLANMSHEIRTPMNGVLGMLELLQKTTQLDEKQKRFARTARNSAKSLLIIINDILDFSKIEAGQLILENIAFDLRKTVEDTIELMEKLALSKKIQLNIFMHNEVPAQISGDPVRLRQMLTNLISNAIKFTRQGEIDIRITMDEEDDTQLKLRFEVKDTGIGVSTENQAELFEAFRQEDGSITRKFGGTGLGLSITKHLAHLMGGEVGINSVKDVGSTFWFTSRFEKVKGYHRLSTADEDSEAMVELFAGSRVLVVDDVSANQFVCEMMLVSMGINVETVFDGKQAVEAVAKSHYDLVLMDCHMPVMDGFAATDIIRAKEKTENSARLSIIAVTARAMVEDRAECLASGMDDYLSKPYEYSDLKNILLRWLPAVEKTP